VEIELSGRVRELSQSVTMAISAKAKEMKRNGIDVVDLSAGEPDFSTPSFVKEAGVEAIRSDMTRYTPPGGLDELRALVAEKLRRENGLEYAPEEVVVTSGAKQAVFNAAFCLFHEGDEVLIPAPYWVSYPAIVTLSGARPVIARGDPERDFKVTVETLESLTGPNTKGMILNSPTNPSGAVYTLEELKEIGRFCHERGLWIISDEIYERIVYDDGRAPSIAEACPEVKDRTVVVNGLSKSLSMTGWRIGYAAADGELVKAMIKLQSHTTSCVSAISQHAAVEALGSPDQFERSVERMVSKFNKRRLYLLENLVNRCNLRAVYPRGTFYLFFEVSGFFGKSNEGREIKGSVDICRYLLEEGRVALVPGLSFGEDGYVRLSYAASIEEIREATDRIVEALEKLR